jgi:hypothetical protein
MDDIYIYDDNTVLNENNNMSFNTDLNVIQL